MKKTMSIFLLVAGMWLPAFAIDTEYEFWANKWLEVTKQDQHLKQGLHEFMEQLSSQLNTALSGEKKEKALKAFEQIQQKVKSEAFIQALQDQQMAIYAKHYTIDELKQLVELYQKPEMQHMLANEQVMGKDIQSLIQRRILSFQPQLMQIIQQAINLK